MAKIDWDGVICPAHEMPKGTDPNIVKLARMANRGTDEVTEAAGWALETIAELMIEVAANDALDTAEARERERCALIAERGEYTMSIQRLGNYSKEALAALEEGYKAAKSGIAAAIRAGKEG